jgi:hypothetical protein
MDLSTEALDQIVIAADLRAYKARQEDSPSREQVARAWERLSDAANTLHAMDKRQLTYRTGTPTPQEIAEAAA